VLVYRGCPIPNDQAGTYTPGATIVWPSFTSATTDQHVALTFSGAVGSGGGGNYGLVPTIFEISTPFYCPLQDISVFSAEKEILLPAFSVFSVETVEMTPAGVRKVRMKHLKDPPRQVLSSQDCAVDGKLAVAGSIGHGPIVIQVPSELSHPAGMRLFL